MSKLPLRIGIWFEENHMPFGGPTVVLLGTILGLYQNATKTGNEIIILLNTIGDVNWSICPSADPCLIHKIPNIWHGPLVAGTSDAVGDYSKNATWLNTRNILFPSTWVCDLVCTGLPYKDPIKADGRRYAVWPSGVDTDYFCSTTLSEKTQDYFIYFKSQNANNLHKLLFYLFSNWFGMKGTIITYYNYDAKMLRDTARVSKFCIVHNFGCHF